VLKVLSAAELRADVKRCNVMRDALELLDWDDPSVGDTQRYLLRAAFSPAFLRVPDGRRFVAFLFTLHPQMVQLAFRLLQAVTCGSNGCPASA
jgi:Condensin II non structural maintenance of chromosomes subunit